MTWPSMEVKVYLARLRTDGCVFAPLGTANPSQRELQSPCTCLLTLCWQLCDAPPRLSYQAIGHRNQDIAHVHFEGMARFACGCEGLLC
jgi:hypothetical protein